MQISSSAIGTSRTIRLRPGVIAIATAAGGVNFRSVVWRLARRLFAVGTAKGRRILKEFAMRQPSRSDVMSDGKRDGEFIAEHLHKPIIEKYAGRVPPEVIEAATNEAHKIVSDLGERNREAGMRDHLVSALVSAAHDGIRSRVELYIREARHGS